MKVLMINGSPHSKGNTYVALHEMEKIFLEEGIKTDSPSGKQGHQRLCGL